MYQEGETVYTPTTRVKILERLEDRAGFETYKVVTEGVRIMNGRPVNVFIAQVLPTLTITGVDPQLGPVLDQVGICEQCGGPLFKTTEGISCPNDHTRT